MDEPTTLATSRRSAANLSVNPQTYYEAIDAERTQRGHKAADTIPTASASAPASPSNVSQASVRRASEIALRSKPNHGDSSITLKAVVGRNRKKPNLVAPPQSVPLESYVSRDSNHLHMKSDPEPHNTQIVHRVREAVPKRGHSEFLKSPLTEGAELPGGHGLPGRISDYERSTSNPNHSPPPHPHPHPVSLHPPKIFVQVHQI